MWSFEVTSHWLDIRRCVPEQNVQNIIIIIIIIIISVMVVDTFR